MAPGNAGIVSGFEFYSTVVKPYFEKPREKEEEAGGSGWDVCTDARKKKSEFLQSESQHHDSRRKGNSRVLDCKRHDWQSATAPYLITSTVHNPRTLAATSDSLIRHTRPDGGHPSWGALVAL